MADNIILGIDPGSNITGYGIIDVSGGRERVVSFGVVKTQGDDLGQKLWQIYEQLCLVLHEHQPHEYAIENVFMSKNAQSALKLGQARGAAITACASVGLALNEYTPREIKQATVGYGSASKEQVQHMVKDILQIKTKLIADAADALAIALTHAHSRKWRKLVAAQGR